MITAKDVLDVLSKTKNISVKVDLLKHDLPLSRQGVDSLDMAVFIFALEEKYSISIPTDKVGDLICINDFVNYLNKTIPEKELNI